MKKGISIWSFTEPDIKKCLMLAKDAGFDGVELAGICIYRALCGAHRLPQRRSCQPSDR